MEHMGICAKEIYQPSMKVTNVKLSCNVLVVSTARLKSLKSPDNMISIWGKTTLIGWTLMAHLVIICFFFYLIYIHFFFFSRVTKET